MEGIKLFSPNLQGCRVVRSWFLQEKRARGQAVGNMEEDLKSGGLDQGSISAHCPQRRGSVRAGAMNTIERLFLILSLLWTPGGLQNIDIFPLPHYTPLWLLSNLATSHVFEHTGLFLSPSLAHLHLSALEGPIQISPPLSSIPLHPSR